VSELVIRPSIAADFDQIDKELPFRVKSMTGLVGDRVIGVGGVGISPDGTRIGFTWLSDEARKSYPKELHWTAKQFLKQAKADGIKQIVAVADIEVSPAAERWLKYLGFEMNELDGEKVWIWHS
jgi:hypothetical protein